MVILQNGGLRVIVTLAARVSLTGMRVDVGLHVRRLDGDRAERAVAILESWRHVRAIGLVLDIGPVNGRATPAARLEWVS